MPPQNPVDRTVVDVCAPKVKLGYPMLCLPYTLLATATASLKPQRELALQNLASRQTAGHSIKAVQAQLGHRSEQSTHMYAHLGSRAQLRLVESLQPVAPPHVNARAPSKKKGT